LGIPRGGEFAGIDEFPFASAELSLLAVSHCLLDLAEALLGEADVQVYGAEAWAKYTGAEVSAAGPAGTVVAFEVGTFHRGTQLTAPRGVRYNMHLNFRPSAIQWGQRRGWAYSAFKREWSEFVDRATPRQLQAFGFPPPGHPYWTPETLAGMALRYPHLDLTPWHAGG
jgi:hypothetical protein